MAMIDSCFFFLRIFFRLFSMWHAICDVWSIWHMIYEKLRVYSYICISVYTATLIQNVWYMVSMVALLIACKQYMHIECTSWITCRSCVPKKTRLIHHDFCVHFICTSWEIATLSLRITFIIKQHIQLILVVLSLQIYWLVVSNPLKHISSSIGMMKFHRYAWKNKMHVPKHQAV